MEAALFDKYYDALSPSFKEALDFAIRILAAYEKEVKTKEVEKKA